LTAWDNEYFFSNRSRLIWLSLLLYTIQEFININSTCMLRLHEIQ